MNAEVLADAELEAPRRKVKQRICYLNRFDVVYVGALALLLFPLYRMARLPLKIDFFGLTVAYWGGTAVETVFFGILFAVIALPFDQTWKPFLMRYRAQKGRIVVALVLACMMLTFFGTGRGLVLLIDILGATELFERRKSDFEFSLADAFFPSLYLFCTFILVFAINHALVGIRWGGTYDAAFDHLDWVLFHVNVTQLAHWSLSHLPHWYFVVLEFIYFGTFGRVTGTIVFTALLRGQKYSVQYVRALLICYSIAIFIYILLPAKGPYSTCLIHLSSYPRDLTSFWTQEELISKMHLLWAHHLTGDVATASYLDYYISFPSMHTALPIIGMWFLRPWKRIAGVLLAVYVTLLLPAIVLLEWHYLVDVAGGMATAALAIWLTSLISRASEPRKVSEPAEPACYAVAYDSRRPQPQTSL